MTKDQGSRTYIVVLILLGAGLAAAFVPCWPATTFIGREDSIQRLPVLSTWRNAPVVFSQDFMIFTEGLYRPLPYAAIAVLRTVVSEHATCFWHGILIFLHGTNALLVFLIVQRLVENRWAAVLSAAVFGFHPIASVMANDISQIHILLGCTLYLASFFGYLRSQKQRPAHIVLISLLAYATGLLTSPVVATLPLVLLALEFVYERSPFRLAVARLLPYLLLTGLILPIWAILRPHPLLYTYAAAEGGEIPSFLSMAAGSKWYVSGLLTGQGIPVVLRDAMRRVHDPLDGEFLLWLSIHGVVLLISFWRMWRRDPFGLGIVIIYTAIVPFLSTAWNPVGDYVSWAYLYLPLFGLALILGQLLAKALFVQRIALRIGLILPLLLLPVGYAARLCRINYSVRGPIPYWTHVARLHPTNQTAQVELGKAYLAEGDLDDALKHLFTQGVQDLNESRRALCIYYSCTGQLRPAMVHASHMSGSRAMAQLFDALEIPDYAESAYGEVLARNPFDTEGMKQLAEILAAKGYVKAARQWLRAALAINSSDEVAREALKHAEDVKPGMVNPPRADWLRFLVNRKSSDQVRAELVNLSEAHRNDPIIQMAAAQGLIEAGDTAGGIAKLKGIADRMQSSPFFAEFYSYALTTADDPQTAARVAEAALESNPRNERLLYHLGTAFLLQKRPSEAVAQYQKAIQLNADFAEAHSKLAYAYAELGQADKAVTSYRRALEINPDLPEARTNLGATLLRKGQVEEAIAQYRNNVDFNPTDARAHFSLGYALAEAGRLDEAIANYSEALRLKPDYVQARNNLGSVYMARDEAGKAVEEYRTALRIKPDDALAHFNLGRALATQGKDEEAMGHYRKAIRLEPNDPQAYYDLAALLARRGDFAGAIQRLTESCRLRPNAVEPADRLAWLLATCGDPALRDGQRAVELAERTCRMTGNQDPRLLDTLAAAYAEAGRFRDAVATAQRALRLLDDRAQHLSAEERDRLDRDLRERLVLYMSDRPYHNPPR
ncbi:MAG: tetratricopeptide repeat protein [Planctomycetota bacterium]